MRTVLTLRGSEGLVNGVGECGDFYFCFVLFFFLPRNIPLLLFSYSSVSHTHIIVANWLTLFLSRRPAFGSGFLCFSSSQLLLNACAQCRSFRSTLLFHRSLFLLPFSHVLPWGAVWNTNQTHRSKKQTNTYPEHKDYRSALCICVCVRLSVLVLAHVKPNEIHACLLSTDWYFVSD